MELPAEIWNTIISYAVYPSDYDLRSRGCILLLPLVNRTCNQICKTNPVLHQRTRKYPYITAIVEQFCIVSSLPIVQFAHENGFASFDDRILLAAAKGGRYPILKYMVSLGYSKTSENALKSIILSNYPADLACLVFLHQDLGIQFSSDDAESALTSGSIAMFDYLCDQGIRPPWTSIPGHFIANPKLKSRLDHLHKKNLRGDPKTFHYYFENGNMAVYEYTHENGLPWPDNATVMASRQNYSECLRYAHEHGAQWHIDTCLTASQSGAIDCLSYAHEHGAEWDRQACLDRAVEYLKLAVEALDAPDYGYSMGYLPPDYNETGLVQCIRYLLVHQDLKYDPKSLVVPSLEEQNKICKDYLDRLGAQKQVNFAAMYDRVDPSANARL